MVLLFLLMPFSIVECFLYREITLNVNYIYKNSSVCLNIQYVFRFERRNRRRRGVVTASERLTKSSKVCLNRVPWALGHLGKINFNERYFGERTSYRADFSTNRVFGERIYYRISVLMSIDYCGDRSKNNSIFMFST